MKGSWSFATSTLQCHVEYQTCEARFFLPPAQNIKYEYLMLVTFFFVFCCSVETRFVWFYTSTICFFLENCFSFASWAHSNSTQEIASRAKKLDRAANLHELLHARRIRGQAAAISITEHWCYRFTLGKYLRWKPKLWFMAKCVACRPQCNRLRNYITRKVMLNPRQRDYFFLKSLSAGSGSLSLLETIRSHNAPLRQWNILAVNNAPNMPRLPNQVRFRWPHSVQWGTHD